MKFSIYLITNSANGKRYVGQTVKAPEARLRGHVLVAKRGAGFVLGAAIRSHGPDRFGVVTIETCDTKARADELERQWIVALGSKVPIGYNVVDGGGGTVGRTCSAETRAKLAAAQRKVKASPATRTKMSASHKAVSAESRAKMSATRTGMRYTPETRAKISGALTGRAFSDEHKARISAAKQNVSAETRAKIGAAHLGLSHTPEARARISSALREHFATWVDPRSAEERSEHTRRAWVTRRANAARAVREVCS